MALYHFSAKVLSRSSRNTVGALAYRAGCKLYDEKTGLSFDYRSKAVEHVELLLPKDAPQWAVEIQKLMEVDRGKGVQAFCDRVEGAEKRMDAQVWREFEFALHRELMKEQNMALAREFIQNQICARGMAAQLNFHFDVDQETGEEKPHCHAVITLRPLDEKGLSPKKEREWNKREFLSNMRVQWQDYSNFHLKLHGHEVRLDHRSHGERGIEIEPQPKMGKNVLELEKRLQKLEGNEDHKPITDKAKAFHDVQLRNLYRIMRHPEIVFEIVSKHHSTFMWADVQKILHRYVDEIPLFQKLEVKLKNSHELMLLKSDLHGKSIYTTRAMLKVEKSLVENADTLGKSKTHGVDSTSINPAIEKVNRELEKSGGLSNDQERAIYHMVEEGQLKCVVGIAGAGKTTALGVCQDIWKESGYAVYGLAPTGKAAQNLGQGGISSMTLHKFLKDFEEGRCHYTQNSVLVLDEAGMVDMERFEHLLGAVQQLGIKFIVVGDGAQLQPVEAGPAFRLVTQRLGKVELNTVLRQKEDWQREATVLFGKQETQTAIQKYMDKGYVHVVEEKLPNFYEALNAGDQETIVKIYEISDRQSSRIFREIMKSCPSELARNQVHAFIRQHQGFEQYLKWEDLEKSAAAQIIKEGEDYRSLLGVRGIDPTKMASLFVDKNLDKAAQQIAITGLLKQQRLDALIGIEKKPDQMVDIREGTKTALIQSWHTEFKENPEKQCLMLAYSNRDVNDLNTLARSLLKESEHISKEEFTYTVAKMAENDFGEKHIVKEEKNFSKGDRIVFTRNNYGLGVKNGTMGTIAELDKQTIQVKLDGKENKEISFVPNLNPYFDQGWAITIHKSQGTTVDTTYLLASYEMTQNLAYVAMTRHRENVHVFGSDLDFWRPEKLPEVLAKSGEKLSPGDYLDTESLNKLMQREDHLLTKIFYRLSNELEAMGAVSKRAFWQVADHFLGRNKEQEIRVNPDFSKEAIREETRAETLLKDPVKPVQKTVDKPSRMSGERVFEELVQECSQKLYVYSREEKISLTSDLIKRIESQSERAANFIFHAHTLKGTRPREKETKHFLLRAKYELNRILEIRDEITTDWRRAGIYKGEKGELEAHLMAERQASIEGRLYLGAKQKSLKTPSNIPDQAKEEIEKNNLSTQRIAKDFVSKQRLSQTAAIFCAQDIVRHMETHGEKPSSEQMSAMAQISKNIDKQGYDPAIGSHNIEYLRKKDGDLQFREWAASQKDLSGFKYFPHAIQEYAQPQAREKVDGKEQLSQVQETHEKVYEMDMSM